MRFNGISRAHDVNLDHPFLVDYVKKPECPARKSGDEWPRGLQRR
jgi:hypothetical protein